MLYDVIIVGAGSAGLPAAMYAARYTLKTLVLGELVGGTLTEAFQVDNYPGMIGQTGTEIMMKFKEHAEKLGAEVKPGKVTEIQKVDDDNDLRSEKFTVTTEAGESYEAKAIILAIGNKKHHLNVPGEDELAGKGVSYCATCDAAFFKDKTVVVAGGGDSAVTAAILLADHAKQVYIVNREAELRAEPIWLESLKQKTNVAIIANNEITKINGEQKVASVELKSEHQGQNQLDCEGVFVEVGSSPDDILAKQLGLETDESGFIKVNNLMATNVPGALAAGDNTVGFYELRQTITAAASGVIAATTVNDYLKK